MTRERQLQVLQALKESGGVLNAVDYPQWATPEQTSEWVHSLRQHADEHAMRKVERAHDATSA